MLPAVAKTPGEVHCYKDVCHRVRSLTEMSKIVGREFDAYTSFYDIPERDRMNTGTLTSSGEAFDAWSDSHAASSLYPDGTELLLWNPDNGRTSHVRVNDFGPFYKRRTIDVTRGVAEKLDFARFGVAKLKVLVIWAPDPKSARYRRQRIYPPVEGYLGRFDYDQLVALKSRLVAQAPERNGQPAPDILIARSEPGSEADLAGDVLAAAPDPMPADVGPADVASAHSLDVLPAYASAAAHDAELARSEAAIVNAPMFSIQASAPDYRIETQAPIAFARTVTPTVLVNAASPRAIAAATSPMTSIVARDADVALAVASLDGAVAARAVTQATSSGTARVPDVLRTAAFGPNSQMWQHVLLTLGLMSAAAAGWRTRQIITGARRASARVIERPVLPPPALPPVRIDPPELAPHVRLEPSVTLAYSNVIQLPQLPQRSIIKSDEALRMEAAQQLEAFDFRAAEVTLRHLLAQRERVNGIDHPLTASAERQLADCLRDQGRFASAEPHYRRALAGMTIAAGDVHPAVADILDEYALCLLRQGRAGDAKGLARQSLAVRRIQGAFTREFAVTLTIVAEAHRAEGNLTEAEADHRTAWNRFVAVSGESGLDAASSMMSLGNVLSERGQFQAAEELLNASARTITTACGARHPASATAYAMLGDLYVQAGHLEAAANMHEYSRDIRERVLGSRHPDTIESVFALALIATHRFKLDDARLLLAKGLDSLALGERLQLGPQARIHRQLVALSRHHDTTPTTFPAAAE